MATGASAARRDRSERVLAWGAVVAAVFAAVSAVLGLMSGQTWGVTPSVIALVAFTLVAGLQFRKARTAPRKESVPDTRTQAHGATSRD